MFQFGRAVQRVSSRQVVPIAKIPAYRLHERYFYAGINDMGYW